MAATARQRDRKTETSITKGRFTGVSGGTRAFALALLSDTTIATLRSGRGEHFTIESPACRGARDKGPASRRQALAHKSLAGRRAIWAGSVSKATEKSEGRAVQLSATRCSRRACTGGTREECMEKCFCGIDGLELWNVDGPFGRS